MELHLGRAVVAVTCASGGIGEATGHVPAAEGATMVAVARATGHGRWSRSLSRLQCSPPDGAVDVVVVEPFGGGGDLLRVGLAAHHPAEQA